MGSGQENVPANQTNMNTRAQKTNSTRVLGQKSDSINRIRTLEKNLALARKEINDIKKMIQTIKTVTKDSKGRTIIITNR